MTPEQQDSLTIITVIKDDLPGFLRTAESVASQINQEFEWLIIDGSNPPLDPNVLEPFSLKCDVKIVVSKPLGIYNAMNRGINETKNQWLWFINAGDFLLDSTAVAKAQVLIANAKIHSLIATTVLHFTPSGFIFSVTVPKIVKTGSYQVADFHHQGVLVKRDAALSINGFDETLRIAADGKFLDNLVERFPFFIAEVPLAGFTLGGTSLKNFSRTLLETWKYRPATYSRAFKYYLAAKSKMRLILLVLELKPILNVPVGIFLRRRQERILKDLQFKVLSS
jgi:glycosyltransferase involved in cell wall biosynthesis